MRSQRNPVIIMKGPQTANVNQALRNNQIKQRQAANGEAEDGSKVAKAKRRGIKKESAIGALLVVLGLLAAAAASLIALPLLIGGCLVAGIGWWRNETEKLEIEKAKQKKEE